MKEQTRYQDFNEALLRTLLYIGRKLELASPQRLEELSSLLKDHLTTGHMIDTLERMVEALGIPAAVDKVQLRLYEKRERGFKVTGFLYDMMV